MVPICGPLYMSVLLNFEKQNSFDLYAGVHYGK